MGTNTIWTGCWWRPGIPGIPAQSCSPVGAIGVMQVMPATGKDLGVGGIWPETPVLAFGTLQGIVVAIIVSLIGLAGQTARPRVHEAVRILPWHDFLKVLWSGEVIW